MNSRLKSVLSATGPMSMLFAGASMVVLAGVTLSPPQVAPGAAPAVQLLSAATPLPAGGDDDSGFSDDNLFSADGSSGVQRDQKSFSGRGFSERQEDKVREEKKESYFNGWFDGFGTGHDLGSSAPAPASSGGGGDHDGDKSKKGDNDDLKDELEDFQDDLKKIAKSQGDSGGGDSSNGKSSEKDGESAEAGSGQGWISSLLAAIGQFVSALVGTIQGSGQS